MKKTLLLLVLLLCIGCDVPQGRYEELAINFNDGMLKITTAIKEAGFVDDKKMDKLTDDMIVVKNATIAAAVKLDEQEDKDQLLAWLEAAQAANTASAPLNPYVMPIGGALSIATILASFFAKKKSDETKIADSVAIKHINAVKEIVIGIEKFKHNDTDNNKAIGELKTALRETTSPHTKIVIAEAKS